MMLVRFRLAQEGVVELLSHDEEAMRFRNSYPSVGCKSREFDVVIQGSSTQHRRGPLPMFSWSEGLRAGLWEVRARASKSSRGNDCRVSVIWRSRHALAAMSA